jgi:hypothetical protein
MSGAASGTSSARSARPARGPEAGVARAYQRPDDSHVFGLTADERDRIGDFESFHPDLKCLWLLAQAGITKEDCYHVLTSAGSNCRDVPARLRPQQLRRVLQGRQGLLEQDPPRLPRHLRERAKVQRELGVGFNSGGNLFFLDELDPERGAGRAGAANRVRHLLRALQRPGRLGRVGGKGGVRVSFSTKDLPLLTRPASPRKARKAGTTG